MFDSREAAFRAMIATDMLTRMGATKLNFNPDGTGTFSLLKAKWAFNRNLDAAPIMKQTIGAAVVEAHITTNAEQFAAKGDLWNARNQQTSGFRPLGENPKRNDFGELCQKATIEGYEGWDEPVYTKPKDRPVLKLKLDEAPRHFSNVRRNFVLGKSNV